MHTSTKLVLINQLVLWKKLLLLKSYKAIGSERSYKSTGIDHHYVQLITIEVISGNKINTDLTGFFQVSDKSIHCKPSLFRAVFLLQASEHEQNWICN